VLYVLAERWRVVSNKESPGVATPGLAVVGVGPSGCGRNKSMTRRILATFLVTGMAFVLAARAQDSRPTQVPALKTKPRAGARPAIEGDPKVLVEDAAVQQDQLRRQFDEFKASLLRLAHHLENSAKPEDKEKAKILKEAITQASKEGIDTKFTTLVNALRSKDTFKDVEQLEAVMQQNQDLRADLKKDSRRSSRGTRWR